MIFFFFTFYFFFKTEEVVDEYLIDKTFSNVAAESPSSKKPSSMRLLRPGKCGAGRGSFRGLIDARCSSKILSVLARCSLS